jgi:hypothetical protein
MNRLVLSLCLVAATYTGHTPNLLQTKLEAPLPADRLVEVPETPLISSPASLRSMNGPEPQTSGTQNVASRSPTMLPDDAQSIAPRDSQIGKPQARLPSTDESAEPSMPLSSEGRKDEAIWFVVVRAATVHAGPSVSSPTVHFYPIGTELNLIGYEQGWFQVSDP